MIAQLLVEAAQDLGAAIEERGVDAEAVEDAGKLDRDVAAADDQDGFRQGLEMERLVGGDGVACARNIGHDRVPARGDQNGARGDFAVAGLHGQRMRVGQLGAGLHDGDAGTLETGAIEALEAGVFRVLVGDQRRPIEARRRDAPAEARRILEVVAEAAGIDEELLRHATPDHASAAEAILLGNRHLGAVASSDARRAHPAGPAADDEEIEVELTHVPALASPGSLTFRQGGRSLWDWQSMRQCIAGVDRAARLG